MARLLAGTADGILSLGDDGTRSEGGVPAPRFLARTANAVFACTAGNAVWRREPDGIWTCVTAHAVDEEVWTFAADPRLPGRLYLGVSPAMLYRSDDGGARWTACESVKRIPGYETWTFPPPPHIPHVRSIAPDPAAPGGVYI